MALADFMVRLGTDASLLRHFDNDPDAAMEDTGLSDDQKRILKDRDAQQISDVIPSPRSSRPIVAGEEPTVVSVGVVDR